MKTTTQIYDQHVRVTNAIFRIAKQRARLAHPETDGSALMCHNWGNDASRAVWDRAYKRLRREAAAYNAVYDRAEHARHNDTFRPLWCPHCKK